MDEYEEVGLNEGPTFPSRSAGQNSETLWSVFCSQAAEYEGIKIFYSNASVYFVNSDLYVSALKQKVIIAVCLFT